MFLTMKRWGFIIMVLDKNIITLYKIQLYFKKLKSLKKIKNLDKVQSRTWTHHPRPSWAQKREPTKGPITDEAQLVHL